MKLKNAREGMTVQVKKGCGLDDYFQEGAVGVIVRVGLEDLYINFIYGEYRTDNSRTYSPSGVSIYQSSSWYCNASRVKKRVI